MVTIQQQLRALAEHISQVSNACAEDDIGIPRTVSNYMRSLLDQARSAVLVAAEIDRDVEWRTIDSYAGPPPCDNCNGRKVVSVEHDDFISVITCPVCGGEGLKRAGR